jgi:paraquat-inducible protein B
MSDKSIQLKVGIFSMLALVLLAVGIVRLASGSFFSAGEDYILYFQGSVTGLNVGAPVVFRGVPLGKVTSIALMATDQDDTVTIPVGIDIVKDSIRRAGTSGGVTDAVRDDMIARMVEQGLRARIATVSYLTGHARVELDLFPDTPARYHSKDRSREIPTLPSPMEEFSRVLSRIDIERIAHNLMLALENFSKVIGSEELRGTLAGFKRFADEAAVLAQEMPALTASARKTLQQLETSADRTGREMSRISHDMGVALDSVGKAANRAEKFFLDSNRLMSPNAATMRDLQNAMKELGEAARAIRSLANNLERSPESLLRGRGRQ